MKRALSVVCPVIAAALAVGALAAPASAADFSPSPHLVKDLTPGANSTISESAVLGSRLVFAVNNGASGPELWTTDGTTGRTRLLKDIEPGAVGSSPAELVSDGTKVYFTASESTTGRELWVTDGTRSGTRLVRDIVPGSTNSGPEDLTVVGEEIFFSAESFGVGRELWRTDGTAAGTSLIKDIDPGAGAGYGISEIVALGDRAVFNAQASASGSGEELWISDDTPNGTVMVRNLSTAPGVDSTPSELTRVGSQVFFSATDGVSGRELYVTDGTLAHTHPVADIHIGAGDSFPDELTAYGDRLVFRASRPGEGPEPWISDGTEGGTTPLGDISAGNEGSGAHDFTAYRGSLYFQAADAAHGSELWVTRGSQGTTHLVKDINPGPGHGEPYAFKVVGGLLVFPAYGSDAAGGELWTSDGTAAGTRLRADISRAAGTSSFPDPLNVVGNTLFLAANDGSHGEELWAYTVRTSTTRGTSRTVGAKTAAKRRVRVPVTVGATATTPTGTVVLKEGARVVGRATLVGGRAKVRITKKLGEGDHRLRASYSGSLLASRSTSKIIRVRVRSDRD